MIGPLSEELAGATGRGWSWHQGLHSPAAAKPAQNQGVNPGPAQPRRSRSADVADTGRGSKPEHKRELPQTWLQEDMARLRQLATRLGVSSKRG